MAKRAAPFWIGIGAVVATTGQAHAQANVRYIDNSRPVIEGPIDDLLRREALVPGTRVETPDDDRRRTRPRGTVQDDPKERVKPVRSPSAVPLSEDAERRRRDLERREREFDTIDRDDPARPLVPRSRATAAPDASEIGADGLRPEGEAPLLQDERDAAAGRERPGADGDAGGGDTPGGTSSKSARNPSGRPGAPGATPAGRMPVVADPRTPAAGRTPVVGTRPDPAATPAPTGMAVPGRPTVPTAPTTTGSVDPRRAVRPRDGVAATGALPVQQRPANTPAEPALPVQPRGRGGAADPYAEPRAEESDYAALGVRVGAFVLRPSLEIGVGLTTNATSTPKPSAGSVVSLAPRLTGASDWSRHSLAFDLKGSFLAYPGYSDQNAPSGDGSVDARFDLTETARIDLKGTFSFARESAGSSESAGAAIASTRVTTGASVGVTERFGPIDVTLRGDVTRQTFTGGTAAGGGAIASEADRNNTLAVAALRLGYEVSPAITPFVEGQARLRTYDVSVDSNGLARDSVGWGLKAGLAFDMNPMLTGEVSVGFVDERPDDPRLGDLRGATFDASLVWSPTRLTKVTLTATTAFEPTTLATSAGSAAYTGEVKVEHAVWRNLTAELGGSLTVRDYQGLPLVEREAGATAGLTWKVNREVGVFLRAGHTRFTSTTAGQDYDESRVLLGVRLER